MDKPVEQDPRVYFAAERTFLAWIRTGLALMGIGFAVSRFGLFLRQVTAAESHLPTNIHTTGLSLWSGVALVALGVIVTVSSALRHVQLIHQLRTGTWQPGRVSRDALILGLVLAALGIYGVISYSVTQRTQEIGVRMALGATLARVQLDVLRSTLILALIGIAIGTIASLAISHLITSLLFGTTPTDPATFAAMILILAAIALLAGYIPARRASRINPMVALRNS